MIIDAFRRFAAGEVDRLGDRYSRALAGNTEGQAILRSAVEMSAGMGYRAWSTGEATLDRDVGDLEDLWSRWQEQRSLTPEAERWPDRLARRGDAASRRALEKAAGALLDAGDELGLIAGVRGRNAARVLSDVGRQAAEAGAALRFVLDEPSDMRKPVPVATPAEAAPAPLWGDTVRVATAANIAEGEMLQGFLSNAGIPSTWRRSGGDLPDLVGAGYRDIHVPLSAAPDARIALATVAPSVDQSQEQPTRRVGLERAPLRLVGKASAVLVIVGASGFGTFVTGSTGPSVLVPVLAVSLPLMIALLAWSELSSRSRE